MTFTSTTGFRWYKKEGKNPILQQKWVNLDSGKEEWRDVPTEYDEHLGYM